MGCNGTVEIDVNGVVAEFVNECDQKEERRKILVDGDPRLTARMGAEVSGFGMSFSTDLKLKRKPMP